MPQTLISAPFGPIGIRWLDDTLVGVDLDPPLGPWEDLDHPPPRILHQFTAYFGRRSAGFDLPVALAGTAFQERVWGELRGIPPGRTRTYGEIAGALGSGPRAVGQACRANPCPIVVPCHRVVASRGLGGFAGDASGRKLAVKRWLLRHEGVADSVSAGEPI